MDPQRTLLTTGVTTGLALAVMLRLFALVVVEVKVGKAAHVGLVLEHHLPLGRGVQFGHLSIDPPPHDLDVHLGDVQGGEGGGATLAQAVGVVLGQFLGGVCVASKFFSAVYFSNFFSKVT